MKKKYLLTIFGILFFLGTFFSYARISDYLEYADIPDTDKIYYNGQFSGLNTYEVFIDTGNIYYITGNDNKIYNCFKIFGTGYTEKLGEIYFQYEGKGSYICNDNKLRGVFKIGAGGWGELEDMDLSDGENWKNYLDKMDTNGYYYHNGKGNDTGTGKARIDGIGFSIWNTVKTQLNLQQVFSNISVYPQIIGNPIADGSQEADIRILLKYNGNPLKNFTVDSVFFAVDTNVDTNVIKNNSNTIAGLTYNGGLKTDENGYLTGKVTSLVGGNNLKYKIGIKIGDNIIYTYGIASFKYPFNINTNLSGDEVAGKILVGVQNKVNLNYSITSLNIKSISFNISGSKINFISPKEYFYVFTGNDINLDNNYHSIKINYSNFFSGDEMQFNYFLTGSYTITKNSSNTYTIKNFKTYSTIGKLYKDGRVNNIEISNDGTYPIADGKSIKWYKIYFKDIHGIPINNITFDYSFEDIYNKFNLNPDNQAYITGFFITGDNSSANTDGGYKIGVISYKPTTKTTLKGYLSNIKFNGYYPVNNDNKTIALANLSFQNIASLTLENKELKVNEPIDLNLSYLNRYNISNPSYKLTGYIIDCDSCHWVNGEVLSSNTTGNKTFNIHITGSIAPSAIIYSGYYKYDLNGNYGIKTVYVKKSKKYSPIIIIHGGDILIKGIAVSKNNLIGGISYITTSPKIINYKNKLRKLIFEKFAKGQDIDSLPSNLEINLTNLNKNIYVYKCNNNEVIKIYGKYNGKYKLFFMGCNIDIIGNITKTNSSDNLELILFQKTPALPDINNTNGWKNLGANIYIGPNVDTIFANILIDGSILTYKGTSPIEENIFYENREGLAENRKQLYINGKIYAKNTIGGGLQDKNNNFTFLGGKKITTDEKIFGLNSHIVTKAYDIKFFRAKLYDSNGKYLTGDLSEIILNKYNCSGDKSTDTHKECYMSLIIEDSNKKFDNY